MRDDAIDNVDDDEPDASLTWRMGVSVRPPDVVPGLAMAYQVVAVVYALPDLHWCAFRGPHDWPREKVAAQGDMISEAVALALWPVIGWLDRPDGLLPYYNS
ncbi:MAG: hypothetical protein IPO08_22630 [Xanthomonadales bacterium]|nr:hypothetical protein [Xanthomonadales bacterium]